MFLVYKLTSPSGKHYIGFTGQTLKRRLLDHTQDAKKKRRKIHHALNKYPLTLWDVSVLFSSPIKEEAFDAEIRYIREYDSISNGYNHSTGGAGSPQVISHETKALISKANKGRKHTEEWKLNHSKALKGHASSEHQKNVTKEIMSKMWVVTHPNGTEERMFGLRQFCIKHNLSQGNLSRFGYTKGFKAQKV